MDGTTAKSYILRQIASKLLSAGVRSENIFYINKEYMELITTILNPQISLLSGSFRDIVFWQCVPVMQNEW